MKNMKWFDNELNDSKFACIVQFVIGQKKSSFQADFRAN